MNSLLSHTIQRQKSCTIILPSINDVIATLHKYRHIPTLRAKLHLHNPEVKILNSQGGAQVPPTHTDLAPKNLLRIHKRHQLLGVLLPLSGKSHSQILFLNCLDGISSAD